MLLICRHHWVRPQYTDPLAPWAVLRRLRADIAADSRRLLPVPDLFFAAARLTPLQIEYVQDADDIRGMDAVKDLQDLLAPLDRDRTRRDRLLGKGLAIAAFPPSARRLLETRYAPLLPESPNGALRLRVIDAAPGQPPTRRAELMFRGGPEAAERSLTQYEWEPTPASSSEANPP
jgi:hypothetical protein